MRNALRLTGICVGSIVGLNGGLILGTGVIVLAILITRRWG